MEHINKTNAQLIEELEEAHRQIAELRKSRGHTGSLRSAQAELRNSEENYRSLVETSQSAIAVLDRNGRILYANPSGIAIWNDPQVVGKSIFDIYPSEYSNRYIKAIQSVIDTQIGIVDEVKSQINGKLMWFRLNMNPLRNPDGSVTSMLLNAWDTTEYKQAEDALRNSESRAKAMLSAIPDMMFRMDRQGTFLDYQADRMDLFVPSESDIIGKRNRDISPHGFAALIDEKIELTLTTGNLQTFEYESTLPNGDTRSYEARMVPSGTDEVIATVRNITEQKHIDTALRESEERFRSLFENSKAIMMIIEPDSGRIIDVNSAAIDFYGYSREQLITMRIEEINQLSPEEVLAERQKAKREERNYFIFPHRLADGQIRTVEVYSHPVKDREGILLYSIIFDITERKQAETLIYAQRDLARAIGQAASDTEAWKICLDTALSVSGMDSGGIYLFNQNGSLLELVHHQGLGDEFVKAVLQFTNDSQNVKMIRSGQVFQFGSAEMEKDVLDTAEGLRSLIVVPILYQGQVIGCLNIASHTSEEVPFHVRHALEAITVEIGNFIQYMRSETTLRASEENFRLIAETIDEVFWMADPELNSTLYISPAYQQVWGRTQKSLYENPKSFIEAVVPEDRKRLLDALELQKNGQIFSHEYRIQHTNGSFRTIWDRGYPVNDENGKVTRYVGVSQDVTERKQIEAEKQSLFDTLNERARELTLLLEAGHELSETLNLDQIYEISYRYISAVMPCNILIISSFDPQSELITCQYLQNEGDVQNISDFPPIPLEEPGKGTQSRVIRSGEPLLLPDYLTALKTASTSYLFDDNAQIVEQEPEEDNGTPRSAIIVPLKANGVTVGAMQIMSHNVNDHNTDHLRFVEAFAFRVSAALSNARLFAELEKRVQERTAEIENTRRRLELATQAAELGIWDWNIKTEKIIWDRQMAVIYETDTDVYHGLPEDLLSMVHPTDLKQVVSYMKRQAQGKGSEAPIQYRIIKSDGIVKHVETRTIVVCNAAGEAEHIIGAAKDITQEKIAEDALRQSEETYRALFDNSNDSIFLMTPDGVEQMANRKALDMLGYTLDEYLHLTNDQLIDPDQHEDAVEKFEAVARGETVPLFERTFRTKDGEKIEVEVNLSPIRNSAEHVFLIQSVVRDITQRKQAEQALRESEERYRKAISAANAVPYSLDYKANRYTFMGEGIKMITGYTRAEMTPTLFDSFIQETGMRGDLESFPTFEATKRVRNGDLPGNLVWRSDFRILTKTGESRWLSDISVQVLDENAQPTGSIGILQDITERKESEEVLRNANLELERALRVKDEFLASMSHELRTPLTGILGLSEALQYNTYGELNEKQRKILANIENSGHHLLDLINDILDISKMEAGKLELDIEPCQLSEVCQASIQLTRGMAQKKEQNVTISMNPASITVMGDHRRLKQILVNLLSNAIKYSPSKSPICLDVHTDAQAQTVSISVSDKGIGIAQDDLKKLFQPFVQVDSSLSRQQTGTGLGLALVKRLVELHSGTLQVESTPGEGSRFTVTLMCVPANSIKQNGNPNSTIQTQKALLVEDNSTDAERLIRYLKILGIKPFIHPAGTGTVEKAIETQPDLILLDIHLPDRSGWDVLEQLKANDLTKNIPVIITSVDEDRTRANQFKVDGYLVKPFSMPDLNTALLRLQQKTKPVQNSVSDTELATVMLVDDNEVNTFMIEDFLQTRNFKVTSVINGLDFLSQVPTIKPDIVLMDIQMPGIDGLETIRRLRLFSDPQLASVPVIAMTALAMPGDREQCLEAGANDYVSKPIRLSELSTLIIKTIEQANAM